MPRIQFLVEMLIWLFLLSSWIPPKWIPEVMHVQMPSFFCWFWMKLRSPSWCPRKPVLSSSSNSSQIVWPILKQVFFCQFRTIRYICKCLQKKVRSRWPQERLVRTRVVSGFIFLRLLCPAILNPRNFNLIAETPSHNASRSLIMVAKCLQNLANLVEFGGKEPYMEVVNPFILKNKERMVYYLDLLSVGLLIQT